MSQSTSATAPVPALPTIPLLQLAQDQPLIDSQVEAGGCQLLLHVLDRAVVHVTHLAVRGLLGGFFLPVQGNGDRAGRGARRHGFDGSPGNWIVIPSKAGIHFLPAVIKAREHSARHPGFRLSPE